MFFFGSCRVILHSSTCQQSSNKKMLNSGTSTTASHRRIHSASVFQFSRPSIYKNIYGQEQKKELQFTNLSKINKAACSAESTVISCNQDFFALPFGTYGSVISRFYFDDQIAKCHLSYETFKYC